MADMRQYAKRLAQAMPDRFKLKSNLLRDAENMPPGAHWTDLSTYVCELRMDFADVSSWWAFWGPLADELKVSAYDVTDHPKNDPSDISPCKPTWLESIADAVCQEAERRKEKNT